MRIQLIDESFYSVEDLVEDAESSIPYRDITGYLEKYDERFFAYHTIEDSLTARKRVTKWATNGGTLPANVAHGRYPLASCRVGGNFWTGALPSSDNALPNDGVLVLAEIGPPPL